MAETAISFEEALSESKELFLLLQQDGPTHESLNKLQTLLSSVPASRGFFVSFLTGDSPLADEVPQYLIDAIKASEHHDEVLTKNLVMSTAMRITHLRNGDEKNAAGSAQVAARTDNLISKINSQRLRERLSEMNSSLKMESGAYADFIKRWGYDEEQRAAALQAIESLKV